MKLKLYAFLLTALSLTVYSCRKDSDETQFNLVFTHTSDVVVKWNDLFLQVERFAAGYRPGPAPRALAYMGLSAYEACISGMPSYKSLAPLYSGLVIPKTDPSLAYHWPTIVNASYEYLMPQFFAAATNTQLQAMTVLANDNYNSYKTQVSDDVLTRSKEHGIKVAKAIWEWSKTDPVGHDHYKDPFQSYDWQTAYKKEGDWKPTFPGPGKPMGGVWGNAKAFAISESDKICRAPLTYSASKSSKLYAQALEVYSQNTPTLSYEDEWIGEFWSDDLLNLTFSPGPRWIAIGNQVLQREKSNLETGILMNAKVGLALNDASIGCWKSKYFYNVERPQTYINRVIDPNWKPALFNPLTGEKGVTPSFPAYPSGHSTMGAAGAEVLASIFGYNYAMTDNCHKTRTEFEGKPRSFTSFLDMAQENAWSRVPLGVHYRMDCEEGVRYGTEIGRKVNNLPWKK
ncbi:MAG: vanadium-dependent haloperoxidase [Saprospiraceae bacterium]|nr:vanadium-dependent haloperoxidase [Saprospiraceae bacterium]